MGPREAPRGLGGTVVTWRGIWGAVALAVGVAAGVQASEHAGADRWLLGGLSGAVMYIAVGLIVSEARRG